MFASENNESVRRNESTSVPLPRPAVPTLNKGIISYKTSDAHVLLLQTIPIRRRISLVPSV